MNKMKYGHDETAAVEQTTATGRLVLTYDGGILVLDALKGDIEGGHSAARI